MSFRDLEIRRSYISQGPGSITEAFLCPALKYAREYKRSVGFFSSSGIEPIMDGIMTMARNGGHVKLISSPRLSEEDINAINIGYAQRQEIIAGIFSRDFVKEVEKLPELRLQMLCDLIRSSVLDIKIAVVRQQSGEIGIYHDKLGILHDFSGNTLVFYGSPNTSYGGYHSNYEKIRVAKSWEPGFRDVVQDEEREFDALWNNTNPFLEVYEYTKIAEARLLEVIHRKAGEANDGSVIELRDYQKDAITAWINNHYHGFFVMATGTGKTWTAIYAAKALVEEHPCMIVICAPYKHLVKQWYEDVEKAFPEATVIMVSSENPGWDKQISTAVIRNRYNPDSRIIIISTISSFKLPRFGAETAKYTGEKLLIVDEAHRFTDRPEELQSTYQYMLGLSATPFSGKSAARGRELMQFFGGQVFNLPIEEALERGFLVPYYYYPIYVRATAEEEVKFGKYSFMIQSCFENGVCIDSEKLIKALRGRLRVISMAEAKMKNLKAIVREVNEDDHFVVYCGDGKLFDNRTGEELRHINAVKMMLSELGYKTSQFTATEDINTRMQLVDSFNKGEIDVLAAIRCLDEGINIPSIKCALILSSNDDYREFVQRRGRILRTFQGKEHAKIFDVIVLPSSDTSWAAIELRRFHEYGKLAKNWSELTGEFESLLIQYGLDISDVDIYDYEEVEEPDE